MKQKPQQNAAFTFVELLVVIAVIALLSALALPILAGTQPLARRVNCSNNLKQLAVAMRTFAADNDGNFPMTLSKRNGGDSEDVETYARALTASQLTSHGASMMFLCMSNELSTPKILFCPAEYECYWRQPASTFANTLAPGSFGVPYTNDLNVSYFVGADATEAFPRMLLAGDHNLGGNADPPSVAFLNAPATGISKLSLGTSFTSDMGPAFMNNMHLEHGNVALADGSVQYFDRTRLQAALTNTGDYGRVPGPYVQALGSTGAGCNRILLP